MREQRLVSVALALGLAVEATAPSAIAGDVGGKVRITTARGKLVGRLGAVTDEAVELVRERKGGFETLAIPRRDALAFEVSDGPGRRGRGAKLGAIAGICAAVAVGVLGGSNCPVDPGPRADIVQRLDHNLCFGRAETGVAGGILTIPLGTLLGAALAPGERWRRVGVGYLSPGERAAPAGRAGAQVSIRF
jgi:hypothetical protein